MTRTTDLTGPTGPAPGDGDGARYLAPLTGIRGVAALYVLVLHLNMVTTSANLGDYVPLIFRGYIGVDLFFVLSGFIISHVYAGRFERFSLEAYGHFMWHRFARIYPVHVAVLAAFALMVAGTGVLGVTLNQPESWRFVDLPFHLTLLHAWGFLETATWNAPAWSISAEWFAYLLFPVAAALARPVRSAAIGVFAAGLILALMAALFRGLGWDLDAAWVGAPAMARVLFQFLIGCLLYRVYLAVGAPALKWDIAGLAALAAFAVTATYFADDFVLLAFVTIFVLSAPLSAGPLRAFLASRPMVLLGEISYSIYMIHFAYIVVLRRIVGSGDWLGGSTLLWLAVVLGSMVVVCAGAWVTFRLIEKPCRDYLRVQLPQRATAFLSS